MQKKITFQYRHVGRSYLTSRKKGCINRLLLIRISAFFICLTAASVNAESIKTESTEHDNREIKKHAITDEINDEINEELLEFLSDFDEVDDETFELVLFHGIRDLEKKQSNQ